jgi:hypothetical protein
MYKSQCVCVCISAIEIQTIVPISMKFGTDEDHDLGIVFMYFRKNPALADLTRTKNFPGQTVHFKENLFLQTL